jgi:hypothetical protein
MNKTLLALAATLATAPSFAATSFGDYVSLSGFGTVGVVSSDNNDVDFVRDNAAKGAGRKESWAVDSKLGVQADIKANSWLSATFQVLAAQRFESSVNADLEWGFVKLKPLEGLSIRIGRTPPTVFMVSDSRNVGYANTTVRMPNEVYALNTFTSLRGVDASYRMAIGGTSLTATAMAGDGKFDSVRAKLDSKDVVGLNLTWDTDFGSFRAGQVSTDVILPAAISPTGSDSKIPYTFTGVGYQLERGDLLVSAEYVERKVEGIFPFLGTKGWYVMGAYRFGNLTPYLTVSRTTADEPAINFLNGNQSSTAVGVRWDAVAGAAVKLQFEAIDPKGTKGVSFSPLATGPHDKTNVVSVAVDFVF